MVIVVNCRETIWRRCGRCRRCLLGNSRETIFNQFFQFSKFRTEGPEGSIRPFRFWEKIWRSRQDASRRLDGAFAFCRVCVVCVRWMRMWGLDSPNWNSAHHPTSSKASTIYHYNLTASQPWLTALRKKSTLNPAQQQLVQCLLLE
jgi:hypothetical protein